jgi:hypothetical protein
MVDPFRVRVHLLEVRSIAKNFPERGQRAMLWASVDRAIELAWNPELKKILHGMVIAGIASR